MSTNHCDLVTCLRKSMTTIRLDCWLNRLIFVLPLHEHVHWFKLFGFPDFRHAYILSANVRLFSSYAKSFNATFTAGPTPWHISSTRVYVSDGLLSMHSTFRLHQTIERLRQFIHLFTESNYLQTRKHYRICFPTMPSGKVQEQEQSEFSDLNLHNECRFK